METMTKEKWIVDLAHSEIEFKIKHLMVTNVRGHFDDFAVNVQTIDDDFMRADVECIIQSASVDTGSEDRDKHIRSADFFDVEHHPEITFRAAKVEKVDNDGSYELWGDLTIKGISKKIKLDVEFGGVIKDPWGNEKAAFTINGKINRKDWNLNWNAALETGGFLVSDEVRVSCELQLMRKRIGKVKAVR